MPTQLTGAVALPDDRCLLFSDTVYRTLDLVSGALADDPLPVGEHFAGVWPGGHVVPVYWGCGQVFFFHGSQFTRYDLASGRAQYDEPRPIAGNWPGVWEDGFDAAFNALNGKVYVFKGSQYLRYDIALERTDAGYPLSIADMWPGVWADGMDAALCPDGMQVLFFRGTEYVVYDLLADQVVAGPLAIDAIGLDPRPAGLVRPARELSAGQANAILNYLVGKGQLTLRTGGAPPAPGTCVAISPAEVAGVRFVNAGARSSDIIDNVDQRMAVALWRLARWANASAETVHSILHLGIGHGSGASDDCHNTGRAIDFSGVEGERDGEAFTLDVQRDWGSKPAPDPSAYRLSEQDEPATSIFQRAYTFGAYECESRGRGREAWPPLAIGQSGFVIYPDYFGSGAQDCLALRRAHSNHIHMQVGPTRGPY